MNFSNSIPAFAALLLIFCLIICLQVAVVTQKIYLTAVSRLFARAGNSYNEIWVEGDLCDQISQSTWVIGIVVWSGLLWVLTTLGGFLLQTQVMAAAGSLFVSSEGAVLGWQITSGVILGMNCLTHGHTMESVREKVYHYEPRNNDTGRREVGEQVSS